MKAADARVTRSKGRQGRLLVAPALLLVGIAAVVPLVYSIWTSFVQYNLRSQDRPFIWFDNYSAALGDPNFRKAMLFTFAMATAVTAIEVTLGTALALALHRQSSRVRFFLLPLLVAPMFVAPVVVGQMWRLFASPTFGVLNEMLSWLPGVETTVDWLAAWPLNVLTLAASDIWQWTPLPLVIVLASLTAFDQHVLEAADVDGASGWQRLRHITLPLLAPALMTATFFRFADALRMYDKIVVLTNGGPGRNTETITFYLVEKGLRGAFDTGVATAASWMFLIVTSLLLYRFLSRRVIG